VYGGNFVTKIQLLFSNSTSFISSIIVNGIRGLFKRGSELIGGKPGGGYHDDDVEFNCIFIITDYVYYNEYIQFFYYNES
jgi:hypothetical protein